MTKAAQQAKAKAKAKPKQPAGDYDQSGGAKGAGGRGGGKGGKDKKKILCKYYKGNENLGKCPDGKGCGYSHNKKLFDPKTFKFVGKGAGKRAGGQEQEGSPAGGDAGWDSPVGLRNGGPQVVIRSGCKESKQAAGTLPSEPGHVPAAGAEHKTGRQRFERVKDTTGNGKGKGALKSLEDLPAHVWKLGPKDDSGIQFYTDVLIGVSEHSVMIDGGSGVNSTIEELVLEILEENRKAGIGLADKRHPMKKLENGSTKRLSEV